MSTTAKQIESTPQTATSLYPHLVYRNASAAIDFYQRAFGATELMRLNEPSGKVGHAELQIGNAMFSLSDEYPDYEAISAETLGGSPIKLHLSVPDVDKFVAQAVSEGARLIRPIEDQFYGDRAGQIKDPFGYTWGVATRKKDVSVEEMQKHLDDFGERG